MIARLSTGRRAVVSMVLVAAGAAVVALLAVPGALGAYSAGVVNNGNTVATNKAFTCTTATTSGVAGPTSFITYPMAETQGTVAADISGGSRNGVYTTTGVTYGSAGPCPGDGSRAITLDGSTGSLSGPNTTYNPSVFSLEIWFRTTTGGGKLIGFGSSRTGASTNYDRHVYLTNAGNVVFGVYPLVTRTVSSPGTYLDGKWHQVVATQAGSLDANPGIRLYVDGALVASDSTVVTNQAFAGYLRIGYDSTANWPNAPTNSRFTGSLAWASFVNGSALTPSQVGIRWTAGRTSDQTYGRYSFSPSASTTNDQYLRHYNYELFVNTITANSASLDRNDATFTTVPGLADSRCVSFVSVNYPTYYLRHNDAFRMRIDPSDGTAAFNQDATFCARPANNGTGTTWAAYDEPTRVWRNYNGNVYVAAYGGPNAFDTPTGWENDTSWSAKTALA